MSNQNRVSAGVPSGGQFAQSTKGEADVSLDEDLGVYNDMDECVSIGAHLKSVDENGYCNHCGFDDLVPPSDEVVDEALRHYTDTLSWSSAIEVDGEMMDNADDYEMSEEAIAASREDVVDFLTSNAGLIEQAAERSPGYDNAQAMHDFALTRNGHGAGFWDRGLGDVGDELTANAKAYGSTDLYLGDDGLLYVN